MFPPSSSFRMEFKPVFLFVYIVGSLAGTILLLLWSWLDPRLANVEAYITLETAGYYIVFFSPLYSAFCAWIMSSRFKYEVTENGIGGKGLIGSSRFARWEDLSYVKPISVGNLSFIRIVTTDGKLPVWLPIFMDNNGKLGGTILRWAPQDNVARSMVRPASAIAA